MQRVTAGDAATAFDAAVSTNREALLGYFQRRLANPSDAAEAFGELLLSAWRSHRRMPRDEVAARMWLYGVARNVLRNTRRALARRSAAVQQLRDQMGSEVSVSADPMQEAVRAAVADLPADDAELVRLVYWDGLPSHEAAGILGLNPSTARSRLVKARAELRLALQDEPEENHVRATTN